MEKIRCKFKCERVGKVYHGIDPDGKPKVLFDAMFTPVYSSDPNSENKKFWEWTPTGRLELGTVKESSFEPGKEYYIDIIPAESAQ